METDNESLKQSLIDIGFCHFINQAMTGITQTSHLEGTEFTSVFISLMRPASCCRKRRARPSSCCRPKWPRPEAAHSVGEIYGTGRIFLEVPKARNTVLLAAHEHPASEKAETQIRSGGVFGAGRWSSQYAGTIFVPGPAGGRLAGPVRIHFDQWIQFDSRPVHPNNDRLQFETVRACRRSHYRTPGERAYYEQTHVVNCAPVWTTSPGTRSDYFPHCSSFSCSVSCAGSNLQT